MQFRLQLASSVDSRRQKFLEFVWFGGLGQVVNPLGLHQELGVQELRFERATISDYLSGLIGQTAPVAISKYHPFAEEQLSVRFKLTCPHIPHGDLTT